MRVLMIAYYFPPCGGPPSLRALRWVRHLPEHGIELTVIAPAAGVFPMVDETLEARVDAAPGPLSRAARRTLRWVRDAFFVPDEYVGFSWAAAAAARRMHRERPFEALLTLSQPHSVHLAGLALRRSPGLPWVAQLADPWTDNMCAPSNSLLRRWREPRMEREVLSRCDVAVGTAETLRDRWRVRFPQLPAGRFQFLPVGYDEADFEGVVPERFERWTMALVGSLYLDRSAGRFLEGLADYLGAHPGERGNISVVFLGAKDEENKRAFGAEVQRLGLGDVVEDRGFRQHREAAALVTGADALLYLGGEPPEGDLNIQCKVFEYLRSGRPALAVSREVEGTRLLARVPGFERVCGAHSSGCGPSRWASRMRPGRWSSRPPCWPGGWRAGFRRPRRAVLARPGHAAARSPRAPGRPGETHPPGHRADLHRGGRH